MADITAEIIGTAGVITLDKQETLNALTHEMVRIIDTSLRQWRDSDDVHHVIIRASGGRAFSAGGDIRSLYMNGRSEYDATLQFFAEEYRLNTIISEFPKPYIALLDGIVMGGGVGVSVNGRFRVGTENIRFAMPEVGIGFFPDVGATWFLPRFPGYFGHYCALTGARLKQSEAAAAGVLTHMLKADELDALFTHLTETQDAPAVLADRCVPAGQSKELPNRQEIDSCFNAKTVEEILGRLEQQAENGSEFARKATESIRGKSPTSLKVALRQMHFGGSSAFRDCMKTEYRIVSRVLKGREFYEGVRATIIDKDNVPLWQPGRLEDVSDRDIDVYFQSVEGGDLTFESL